MQKKIQKNYLKTAAGNDDGDSGGPATMDGNNNSLTFSLDFSIFFLTYLLFRMKSGLEIVKTFRNIFENVAKSTFSWLESCWHREKWKTNLLRFTFRNVPLTHVAKTWNVMFLCQHFATFKDNHITKSGKQTYYVSLSTTCLWHTLRKLETLCFFVTFSRRSRTPTS